MAARQADRVHHNPGDRDMRPNRYVANAIIPVTVVLLVLTVLVDLGVYDGIKPALMRVCAVSSIILTLIPQILARVPKISRRPFTKYIILADINAMVLLLASLLNIHVTLVLVLPMLLITQYYNERVMLHAAFGALIICVGAPMLAYTFNTWSYTYLSGYIEIACHVTIHPMRISPDIAKDVRNILLFMVLPQMFMLLAFSFIFRNIARNGERIFQQNDEIRLLNTTDNLTGLYNKKYFDHLVRECLDDYPWEKTLIAVVDIVHFKLYNDTLGFKAGDELLRETAEHILSYAPEGAISARMAYDHMLLFMNRADFHEDDLIRKVLSVGYRCVPSDYRLVLRAGVFEVDDRNLAVSAMCDRALIACHSLRGDTRQSVARYDSRMLEEVLARQKTADELSNALRSDGILIYLQPQVRPDGTVVGAEALARWKHPERGMVPPSEFVPICEEEGSICELDRLVWEKACARLAEWKARGRTDLSLSVNVSSLDFYKLNVYETLTGLVKQYGISPASLRVEITETLFMIDPERQKELIHRLRVGGFHVEIDDFGSGYSSLGMLKDINADTLKLDLSFLGETEDIRRGRQIITAVAGMAHSLGMELIAEGVETKAQMDFLISLNCDLFQGFLFSKPIPEEEFEARYVSSSQPGHSVI